MLWSPRLEERCVSGRVGAETIHNNVTSNGRVELSGEIAWAWFVFAGAQNTER